MKKVCKKHDKISECADCGKLFYLVPVEVLDKLTMNLRKLRKHLK